MRRCSSSSKVTWAPLLNAFGQIPLGLVAVFIIAVDCPDKIEAVLPELDEMVDKEVVTTHPVRVILSRPSAI